MTHIHPTAIIEKGAQLDTGVKIGPFARIGAHVRIGKETTVASHAVIEGRTTIGERNRIFSHAAIGTIPQDLKYNGEASELHIGNDNIIREFTLFNTGTQGGGMITRIGNHNLFMGYVHVGHDAQIGNHCILANAATLGGHVEMEDYVVIGGLTPIHQFVKIGAYAMVAGGSVLTQDLPPYCLAEGNRAVLKGLNLTGLRRNLPKEAIDPLKRAYKRLFRSQEPLKHTAQKLMQEDDNAYIHKLCKFVLQTQRGIPFERNNTQQKGNQ